LIRTWRRHRWNPARTTLHLAGNLIP